MSNSQALIARRDDIIDKWGPWIAFNINLGNGVYTISPDFVGTPEFMIHGLVQVVADLAHKPLEQLRVLDLGCHEGGYAIELGRHGCSVVGVEGREQSVVKARFAADCLGLRRVQFIQDDVRNLSCEAHGTFDVVLCFGILYHLETADAVRLIERCYSCCEQLLCLRTAIGLRSNAGGRVGSYQYRGRWYAEDTAEAGASLGNRRSVLPTKASLTNLLADVGFSSVLEVNNPAVPGSDALLDNLFLVANKGRRVPFRSCDGVDELTANFRHTATRLPSWMWRYAHPQQGLIWRLRERVAHSYDKQLFQSRRQLSDWRDRLNRR